MCISALVVAADPATAADFTHVRSDDASIRALLRDGYERSATFKTLVDDIESRPGIVYIAQAVKLSRGMEGALLHAVAGSPAMPFLRVLIKTNLAPDYAIAVLAHELQHVVEVLRAGPPKDAAAIAALFAVLDHQTADSKFETEDARAIASLVRGELRAQRRL
jgi:hypothetical protein